MNWDQVKGDWKQMKGSLLRQWGKLTDDDLAIVNGDRNILVGRLQERYGLRKEDAERQLNEFIHNHRDLRELEEEVAREGKPVDSATLKIGM